MVLQIIGLVVLDYLGCMFVWCSSMSGFDKCLYYWEGGVEVLECQFYFRLYCVIWWLYGLFVQWCDGLDYVQLWVVDFYEQVFGCGQEVVVDFFELFEGGEFWYGYCWCVVLQFGVEVVLFVGLVGGDWVVQCFGDFVGCSCCEGVQCVGDKFEVFL